MSAVGSAPSRCQGRARTPDTPATSRNVVAWLAQRRDKTSIGRLLRCSWKAVDAIVARVVVDYIDDSRLNQLYRIGVEEISYKRGHRFLTELLDAGSDRGVSGGAGYSPTGHGAPAARRSMAVTDRQDAAAGHRPEMDPPGLEGPGLDTPVPDEPETGRPAPGHGPAADSTVRLAVVIGALGVVFGDIGTSPIYTLQTVFNPDDPHPVPVSADNVFGVVSLIFWSVMIIVTVTYVLLAMRVDNDGEGGIMALITLLRRWGAQRGPAGRRRAGGGWASSARRCSSATA